MAGITLKEHKELMAILSRLDPHPFPFIRELYDLKEIKEFKDIIRVSDFVFVTLPYVQNPFNPVPLKDMENRSIVDYFYNMSKTIWGGWCALNSEFLIRVLEGYGIKSQPYNHGFTGGRLTHMAVLVDFNSKEYLVDPYFCRHYTDAFGNLISFNDMMELIIKKEYDKIKEIRNTCKKKVFYNDDCVYMKSDALEEYVLSGYRQELNSTLIEKYGDNNFLNLLRTKI